MAKSGIDVPEDELLNARRNAIENDETNGSPTQIKQSFWGLALSGGGIRSATFSLGVLQAIAEAPTSTLSSPPTSPSPGSRFRSSLLSRFDYISTVSGGGYIGAFLCGLFMPGRLEEKANTSSLAADKAVEVLASGPPGRIHSEGKFEGQKLTQAPLAWLRENGRYLIPTGTGDAVYAMALGIRNWAALQYVIGTVLLVILSMTALARNLMSRWCLPKSWEVETLEMAVNGAAPIDHIWWSIFFPVAAIALLVLAVPFGFAYWLSYESKNGEVSRWNLAVRFSVLVAVIFFITAFSDLPGLHVEGIVATLTELFEKMSSRQWLAFCGGSVILAGTVIYVITASVYKEVAKNRTALTHLLALALQVVGVLLAIAVIDTLGQSFYLWSRDPAHSAVPLTPTALVVALVWVGKLFAAFPRKDDAPSLLKRIPITTSAGFVGVLIFVLVASIWSWGINWLIWDGAQPMDWNQNVGDRFTVLFCLMISAVGLALITGQFAGFINLSSLQPFYSARLTRAYLGASNKERYEKGVSSLSAAEPLPQDNLSLKDFYTGESGGHGKLTTFAPLHIINVTLNKTVDPAEQLVQRDRKGQPLAVLPYGFSVEGRFHKFLLEEAGTEIQKPLAIGQWIGTSGAAFSTGIGRETSLGMSLLMGMLNVRLGTWWESGCGERKASVSRITETLVRAFRTQVYLSYEFRARFFGMRRDWQYLSDGGHFENTAIYELLRPSRKVRLILASDNGADPNYCFNDLANLIRLARVDLRVDVSVVRDFKAWPELSAVFCTPEDFRPSGEKVLQNPANQRTQCAVLLKATWIESPDHSTWIVLLKPTVLADAAEDIQEYARTHNSFPQESTTDQFFDEAQWESYRNLGYCIARKVLHPTVFAELQDYIDHDGERPS